MRKRLNFAAIPLLILCFALFSACATGSTLATPEGISLDDAYTFTWLSVEGARGYQVGYRPLEGAWEQETTRRTYFSFASLEEGDYEVRVRAYGGNEEFFSEWTQVYEFHRDYENGLVYSKINNNTEYAVTAIGTASGEVTVGERYRGKPVTEIGDSAFRGRGSGRIERVVLGNSIVRIGSSAFYNCNSMTSVVLPESLVSLGESAFQGCSSLTEIELPAGVTSIPDFAFSYCGALRSVRFDGRISTIGNSAFYSCGSLASLEAPEGLTSVGEYAFGLCGSLSSVTFGDGLGYIGSDAFYKCGALTDVTFGAATSLTLENRSFELCTGLGSVELPEGTVSVGARAFSGDSSLAEISLPESLEKIGSNAFAETALYAAQEADGFIYADRWLVAVTAERLVALETLTPDSFREGTAGIANNAFLLGDTGIGAPALREVELPASVKRLGDYAFYNCAALSKFITPDGGLLSVGEYALAQNFVLSNAQFGKGLLEIGNNAFRGDAMLNNNRFSDRLIPDTVERVGTYAFYDTGLWSMPDEYGVIYAANWVVGYAELSQSIITLSDSVVGVGNYAFMNCEALEGVTGLSRAEHIGAGAFYGCSNLAGVSLNRNLTAIADYTFYGCSSLFEVDFPVTLRSIGTYAFGNCNLLHEIDLSDSRVRTIGTAAFFGDLNLVNAYFGDDLEQIGASAFRACASLAEADFPESLIVIGDHAFARCAMLGRVSFAEGLQAIGPAAFRECVSLTDVVFPTTLSVIGHHAFYKCTGLTGVSFGGTQGIGDLAFYGCTALESVVLPESVSIVGSHAFRGCTGLEYVLMQGPIASMGAHVFYGCPRLTIYAACGKVEGWTGTWNSDYRPVLWNAALSEDGSYVVSVSLEGAENAHAWGGITVPQREGYLFAGWAGSEGGAPLYGIDELAPETGTLYAVWTEAPAEDVTV